MKSHITTFQDCLNIDEDIRAERLDYLKTRGIKRFVEECLEWKAGMIESGEWEEKHKDLQENPRSCPISLMSAEIGACTKDNVPGIRECPLCDTVMCPDCCGHAALAISRVTGYLQDVSGWNAAKRQELRERKHHDIA